MKKQEVLAALAALRPAIEKGDDVPMVRFFDECIIAWNGVLCIEYPLTVGIDATIRSDKLESIMKGMSEDAEIEFSDGEEVQIAGGRRAAGVPKIAKSEIASVRTGKEEWMDLPAEVVSALKMAAESTADNTADVYSMVELSEGRILATDRSTVFRVLVDTSAINETIRIPAGLIRCMGETCQFSTDGSFAHIATPEGLIYSHRIPTGDFKTDKMEAYLDTVEGTVKLPIPDGLADLIRRNTVFSSWGKLEAVELHYSKKKLTVTSKNDSGWVSESMDIKGGTEASFYVNPDMLIGCMARGAELLVGERVILIQGEGFTYVISKVMLA